MTAMHVERRPIRRILNAIPSDLLLASVFTLAVDALVLASAGWGPVRFLLGMILLFFVPGYALVGVLFPGRPHRSVEGRHRRPTLHEPRDGLLLRERLAISFGTSVALVPVVAVLMGLLSIPLTAVNVLASVTIIVLTCGVIGSIRRVRLRPEDRYVPFEQIPIRGDGSGTKVRRSRLSPALTAGLVVAIALAGGAFVYGIAAEPPSSQYSSALLLTETDDGSFIASGYPTNVTEGDPLSLTLRVDNRRSTASTVSAAVVLERPGADGDVVERARLTTLTNEVSANGRWNATHEVSPTIAGDDLRLAYYVYDGDLPAVVGPSSADHELYLRIDVQPTDARD